MAMEAGKNVIVEKPMEIQLDRIERMAEVAKKNKVRLAGIFQNRWNPANRASALRLQDAQRVSRARSVQLQPVEVRRPDELDAAFAGSIAGRASAFILDADPIMHDHAKRIVGLV